MVGIIMVGIMVVCIIIIIARLRGPLGSLGSQPTPRGPGFNYLLLYGSARCPGVGCFKDLGPWALCRGSRALYMGGCQNYGPFGGTLNNRCRIIIRTKKGP